jgi:hypothetical protein
MKVTSLGHAALSIETDDQRILIDPVFAETLANGAVHCNPGRHIDIERLGTPTALYLTSSQLEHLHAPTLLRFPKDLPVFIPEDVRLRQDLEEIGFSRIQVCAPWQPTALGQTQLVGTPAGGVAIFGGGSFWNISGTGTIPADGARLFRSHGRIDVVAAKYQPSERAAMNYVFGRTHVDKALIVRWLETACAARPRFIFPHASGYSFGGRYAWLNRYVFPFSPQEIVALLRLRSGVDEVEVVNPGDVVEVQAGKLALDRQASPFASTTSSPVHIWEPVDTATLDGLNNASERTDLETLLDRFLTERLVPWLYSQRRAHPVVWQLVVEAGEVGRIERFIEYTSEPLRIATGRHPFANTFTHVSGRTLLDVLRHEVPGPFLGHAGQARCYEKAIGVAGGRLIAAIEGEVTDPLTYFLMHFGPEGEGNSNVQAIPDVLELLPREVENPPVLRKKILLSILALREAPLFDITITEADAYAASDRFRRAFGLEDGAEMVCWLDEAGLTPEDFMRTMRDFAAVNQLQEHWSEEIETRLDTYAKIGSIRSRQR